QSVLVLDEQHRDENEAGIALQLHVMAVQVAVHADLALTRLGEHTGCPGAIEVHYRHSCGNFPHGATNDTFSSKAPPPIARRASATSKVREASPFGRDTPV